MSHPDPAVQRQIEQLFHYANGLLDAGQNQVQVTGMLMGKGLDYETAEKFVTGVVAARVARSTSSPQQPTVGPGPQAASIEQPSPEIRRQIQQLGQNINLLLDRGEPVAAVLAGVIAKGLERPLACTVIQAVLTNRLIRAFPVSDCPPQSSPEQMRLVKELAEYAHLLLGWGEGTPAVTQQLLQMGLDKELAAKVIVLATGHRTPKQRLIAGIGSGIFFFAIILVVFVLVGWQRTDDRGTMALIGLCLGSLAGLVAGVIGYVTGRMLLPS
jgi:hypothetical protein